MQIPDHFRFNKILFMIVGNALTFGGLSADVMMLDSLH